MIWRLVYTEQAQKIAASGLKEKAEAVIQILRKNPFQTPPPFEKLVGDLVGAYSPPVSG